MRKEDELSAIPQNNPEPENWAGIPEGKEVDELESTEDKDSHDEDDEQLSISSSDDVDPFAFTLSSTE